jgi:predicted lipoprotein with Yx(FWY)xxD motif
MRKHRHVALVGTAIAVAMFATGCGSTSSDDYSGQKIKPAGNAAAHKGDGESSATSKRDAPAKTLEVKPNAKIGDIVTDSKGWTLYRFDEDTASPSQSNCNGNCEKMWPPVPAKDAEAGKGIAKQALGKVKRSDGSWQLTVGGWPVYRYAKDAKPGDLKGHGMGGNWNALAPDGNKASPKNVKELKVVDNPELGKIVADAKGRTLYRFDKDTPWPMKSNCDSSACLKMFKPAKAVDKDKISGIDPKLLSTYKRADGTEQVSMDCWPLYWFTGDEKPGDINGQGKKGVWHAATNQGKKAGVAP